jgi:hypothetical protein
VAFALPFQTWLQSDDKVLRETVEELVYVHGKFWCGTKMKSKDKEVTRVLLNRVMERVGTDQFYFVEKAIGMLAQTEYGLK